MDIPPYDQILDVVRRDFPSQENQILKILGEYGIHPQELEVRRVQLAILNLSNGDIDKLKHYLSVAKNDYHEFLIWGD